MPSAGFDPKNQAVSDLRLDDRWHVRVTSHSFKSPTLSGANVILILRPPYFFYSFFEINKLEFGVVCVDSRLTLFRAPLPDTVDLYRYFFYLLSLHLP